MAFAPAAVIEGPARLPLPFGLFSVVSLAEASTERWENGVTWEALTCDPVSILVGACDDPYGFPKNFRHEPSVGEAAAFTVYGTFKCSPIGQVDPFAHAQQQARAVLQAREEQAAEGYLWASMMLDSPTTLTDGGDVIQSLGALEGWIGEEYGSLGVIHVSRRAATTLTQKGLIRPKGGQMQTNLGTPVVVGSGYPGSGEGIAESQTITVTETVPPISGTFTLTLDTKVTGPIDFDATAAEVAAALNALDGVSGVTGSGGPLPGTVTVTFAEGTDWPLMSGDPAGLTNGTVGIGAGVNGGFTAPSAGSEYIAATPGLFGYRSEVFEQTNRPGDLLDRLNNDLYGIAERNYLIGMEPCGVAIVELPLGCCSALDLPQ